MSLRDLILKVDEFKLEAATILGQCESSSLRVVNVEASLRRLDTLTLDQGELMRQALLCTAQGLYRAAIVSSWAAFMDALELIIASDGLVKLHAEYPSWGSYKTIEDLRDNVGEYQLVEAAKKLRVLTKGETKIIQGHLAKRNKCAHPSELKPQFNDTLGYASEMIDWLERLSTRSL